MKKILFALPILAIGFFATYCSKENVNTVVPTPAATVTSTDRGGQACDITIRVKGSARICGLANNNLACLDCGGQNLPGRDDINLPGGVVSYNLVPGTPSTRFAITNTSTGAITVDIFTSGVPLTTWSIPAGQCFTYGLTSTCGLLADQAPI